jgi:hypothetical protein
VGNLLHKQFVSGPLAAQTISGTFSIVLRGGESAMSSDASLQIVIRVLSGDGTVVRGTLFGGHTATLNTTQGTLGCEMPTSTSSFYLSAIPLTSVNAQAGDRLVVELGHRYHNVSATSYGAFFTFHDDLSLPEFALTNGVTTSLVPWIEFSGNIAPFAPLTQVVAQRATSWDVDAPISTSITTSWSALQPTPPVEQPTLWAVLTTITRSIPTMWACAAVVSTQRQTTWAVQPPLSGVATQRTTSWAVRGQLTSTRITRWNVTARISTSQPTTWAVLASTVKTAGTTWAVLTRTANSYPTTWAVLTQTSISHPTTWTTRSSISTSQPTMWSVLVPTVKTAGTTWATLAEVASTRAAMWTTCASLQTTRATTWAIRPPATTHRPDSGITLRVITTTTPRPNAGTTTRPTT